MKILFLAHLFPLPLDSGGKIKSYYTLRTLAGRHEVHVLAFTRSEEERALEGEIRGMCAGVDVVPLERGRGRQIVDLAGSLASGSSFIVARDFRPAMQRLCERAVADFEPDVIHIDHLQMAQFVPGGARCRTVLDNHNVESMILRRVSETAESAMMRAYARLEWPKLKRYELEVCRGSSLVLTVSEQDKATLREMEPSLENVETVPIGVDVHYFQPLQLDRQSRNILSIGTMYWPPNVDAMLYFYREILPLVRREAPDCVLTIAGQRPVESIQALARDPGVRVTGRVDDVPAASADCGVFIVPLRSGSGVRVKILNALALGLPVVSTSVGAEGLGVTSGEELIIADTPAEFADAVVRVLRDRDLAERLGRNGRRLVCEEYSWERVGERLLGLYDERLSRPLAT